MIPKLTKQFPPFSDAEVITEILSGNDALFEILMRRYNSFLYKVGRGYGFNHQDTEDLMQDTYINSYQNLSKFENRCSFKTWIIRIMLNHCYHKKQKFSYQKEKPGELSDNYNSKNMLLKSNPDDAGKSIIIKELNTIIETCLENLPEDYRMTFTFRELAGLSIAETAEMMNTTPANVKVRLNRAKMIMRKEIEKKYTPDKIYGFNAIYCDRIVSGVMKEIYKQKSEGRKPRIS